MNADHQHHASQAPTVTSLQVIPVAGHDSMLLNLSGAHGPFFTRNIVILKDSSGNIGVGEVPGGERIRETLEDARNLVVGQPIGNYQSVLNAMRRTFAARDSAGRGCKPSTCASPSTPSRQWRPPCSTCSANSCMCRSRPCSARASNGRR